MNIKTLQYLTGVLRLATSFWVIALFSGVSSNADEVTLLKTIEIPGNSLDRSGLKQQIEPGIWHDLFGGISALQYTGADNLYLALGDRGPKDGAVDWTCRYHVVRLNLAQQTSVADSDFSIDQTVLLTGKTGSKYSGLSTNYTATDRADVRLDPEGIRVDSSGSVWISEEYGPTVIKFSTDGKWLGQLDLPTKFKIREPGPDKATENNANQSGRQGNRGMEGLAISDDGRYLFGLVQSPLLQDCQRTSAGKPQGLNCRLLKIEIATGETTEFLYRLDHVNNKLNEIMSYGENQFLVIERDGRVGSKAKFKKVMKIDISAADSIGHLNQLPATNLPEGVQPVQKQVFIDLLDSRFGLVGSSMPEKIESLTRGPDLPDGRQTLLIASDNDFNKQWATKIFCFGISPLRDAKRNDFSKTNY